MATVEFPFSYHFIENTMQTDDILKLDIKLLVAFTTIMDEGNVSRAAEKLGLTQPALSKSLQRLRELFKDSLFTRQAYGLTPTARASELYDQIVPILHSLTELMSPNTLDLKNLNRCFRLRADEGELENFIEPLLASLHYEAPKLKLSISSWGDTQFDQLTAGNADIGIKRVNDTPSNIRNKLIGYMDACIVLSKAHPLFHKESVTLEELLQHKFVTHHRGARTGSTFIKTEQKLKQQGYDISPALETDSLMVAMQAVKRGMAFVASRSIGDLFLQIMSEKANGTDNGKMNFHPVKLLPIPKEVIELDDHNGRHPIHIFWHERFNNDLTHRWLREKIIHFMRESPWMHQPDYRHDDENPHIKG